MRGLIGEFFVEANGKISVEQATDSNWLMKSHPEYYRPRFEAIASLRKADDGTGHRGQEFRRVASFVNMPLFDAVSTVLNPNLLKDKRQFYRWLDTGDNWRYCTYDRRRSSRPIHNQVTFVGGKEV